MNDFKNKLSKNFEIHKLKIYFIIDIKIYLDLIIDFFIKI